MPATKKQFLETYFSLLREKYQWTQDHDKMERFVHSVTETVHNRANTWNHHGEVVTEAWKSIGGKGKPSLSAMRELPDE